MSTAGSGGALEVWAEARARETGQPVALVLCAAEIGCGRSFSATGFTASRDILSRQVIVHAPPGGWTPEAERELAWFVWTLGGEHVEAQALTTRQSSPPAEDAQSAGGSCGSGR